ncbi:eCIS core domain-containing protein [Tenacibaculum salmonis]|uniref:eCIS core domain-containing protein n=1 Tax=Tenacibaculum sp. P3-BQ1 TaxID=3232310 RepID=UPI0034E01EB0
MIYNFHVSLIFQPNETIIMSLHLNKLKEKTPKLNSKKEGIQSIQFKDNRTNNTKNNTTLNAINNSSRVIAQRVKSDSISNTPIQRQENKTGLPNQLKSGIENLSGIDMSDTRVHYNSSKPAQLQAHAYAQGNDIHLASGQEKHLPHEAWHVVQQKQGRVKATTQLKGKTLINDDAGLEHEADVMGAKALQMKSTSNQKTLSQKTSNTVSKTPIQCYSAHKDKLSQTIYNVSRSNKFVVGLGYPNHELYIKNPSILEGLNDRAKEGFLKFTTGDDTTSFKFGDSNENYYKVKPMFNLNDKKRQINPATQIADESEETTQNHLYEGIKKSYVENLALPEDADSSDDEIMTKYSTNVDEAKNMYKLRVLAETIRKSIVQMDYKDDGDVAGLKGKYTTAFFRIIEYVKEEALNESIQKSQLASQGNDEVRIKSIMAQKTRTKKSDIMGPFNEFKEMIPQDSDLILMETVQTNATKIAQLLEGLPNESSKRQSMIGHFNAQVSSIENKELMLMRGCDYVAGTTMGKVHKDNIEDTFSLLFQLRSGAKEHHHYSTKLLADGSDFISIEGFAGGYQTHDNTWEFFLHGGEDTEAESFKKYTTSRYDFFPDTKSELADMKGDNNENFTLHTDKTQELDNVDKTTRTLNKLVSKGGANKTYKFYTEDQQKRDHFNNITIPLLYNAGIAVFDNIPDNLRNVLNDGYDALKNNCEEIFWNNMTTKEEVISNYQHQLERLINTKIIYHENYMHSIANSKDYLTNKISTNSITVDEKADDLITACDNYIRTSRMNYASATYKKSQFNSIKAKVRQLELYKQNSQNTLDHIN